MPFFCVHAEIFIKNIIYKIIFKWFSKIDKQIWQMLTIGLLDGGHMFIVPFFLTFLFESFYNENEVENIAQI